MGADNHSTTRAKIDNNSVRRERLKNDLAMCDCITGVRDSMLAGIVVETTERGFEPDALGVLNDHNARIGANKSRDDPWEVFLE